STQELVENMRVEFFAADIIEKEKWTRPEHRNVIHAMIDEIGANGVVLVQRECDLQFRADAINARDQNWIVHLSEIRAKQPAESADFIQHLRPVGLPNEALDAALESIAKIDIYARRCISLFCLCRFHGMFCRLSRDKSAGEMTKSECRMTNQNLKHE